MNRLVIITVGKTHSGNSTFARALEKELNNSIVMDQDNQAEFLQTFYNTLQPKQGSNNLKHALSQLIVDYAMQHTDSHLIICNSNRNRKGRLALLDQFHNKGFTSILVEFDLPEQVLLERVVESQRDTSILRTASNFSEVLVRQHNETNRGDVLSPIEGEAAHLFIIKDSNAVQSVIDKIVRLA